MNFCYFFGLRETTWGHPNNLLCFRDLDMHEIFFWEILLWFLGFDFFYVESSKKLNKSSFLKKKIINYFDNVVN